MPKRKVQTRDEWLDAENLKLARLVLQDLGLKMPRLTRKYLAAVKLLSQIQQTSDSFIHEAAARKGSDLLYQWLDEYGYEWKDSGAE